MTALTNSTKYYYRAHLTPPIVHHYDTGIKVLTILLIIMVIACVTIYKIDYESKQ
jgi:hypothetical protein